MAARSLLPTATAAHLMTIKMVFHCANKVFPAALWADALHDRQVHGLKAACSKRKWKDGMVRSALFAGCVVSTNGNLTRISCIEGMHFMNQMEDNDG